MTQDGHCYEQRAIYTWFMQKQPNTSPNTGEVLSSGRLVPNLSLKSTMDEWVDNCRWLDVLVFGCQDQTRFWTVDRSALSRKQKLEHFINFFKPAHARGRVLAPLPPKMKNAGTQTEN